MRKRTRSSITVSSQMPSATQGSMIAQIRPSSRQSTAPKLSRAKNPHASTPKALRTATELERPIRWVPTGITNTLPAKPVTPWIV